MSHEDAEILPPMPEKGFYYHYKHDPAKGASSYAYEVIGVGYHTEDNCRPEDQYLVVYRPLYDAFVYRKGKLFDIRPLSMFMEFVTKEGVEMRRFTKIEDPAVIAELTRIRDEMYT